ncbi:MAG: ribosomal RNA small subunit methyltransferase I [Candidatus Hepatoplasma vulgare]|nr:MAG: ribosomal RNA small subunit methyltransferase I [Candidatus Hepatoplasma sp.]
MNNVYIIATPIGNLDDITIRALNVLKNIKFIFCEDTRHSKILFEKYSIKNRELYSLNKFNESSKELLILKKLKQGDVAIISDAGTPTISDPGQFILKKLKEKNINLIPIPGPNSIISALSASGEIYKSFSFLGFLPKTKEKIKSAIFENMQTDLNIFFESSNRIKKTLQILKDEFGDFPIILAKEITKKFENIKKDKPSNFLNELNLKGEFVLIINNKEINKDQQINYLISKYKNKFTTNNDLINYFVLKYNLNKTQLYNIFKK